ncbi:uncharacterized protein LOC110435075 isoform X1 [Sorghum bicolor]|uniref:uncharacterized protein LOC110435075 isoform X1 n=1 Tax=Sorghum bicolor TaxID=4558 RepID=UPI000B423A7E|nr:uncharacterized protein LOC110435075 isoform X1 [Sorghum bicolor]|eukprot:XP_021316091.1 uncharacterized protein LOC110435075 isoform X1 [Sorghum bicolor]
MGTTSRAELLTLVRGGWRMHGDGEKRHGTTRPADLEPRPGLRRSLGLPRRLLPRSVSGMMAMRAAVENRSPMAWKPTGVRDMESQHHTFFSSLQERCLLLCCKILSFFREELKGRKEDNIAK